MRSLGNSFLLNQENMTKTIGRNDKCPCGSGLKYKKCCLAKGITPNTVISQKEKISKTFQYIATHESEHILNFFIGLQLTIENHGKNVRIEELARYLVTQLNNGNTGEINTLKDSLDSEYSYNNAEDIPENLFCENIIFHGGNYTVFPGIAPQSVEILRKLTESIFTYPNSFSIDFKRSVHQGITLILSLGEILANKLQIKGNISAMENIEKKFLYKFCNKDFGITQIELEKIFLNSGIRPNIINDFILSPEDERLQLEDPDLNPLLYYPIIKFNNKYFFIMISNQVEALNEFILRLSEKYNCNQELVRIYHDKVWHDILEACDKMQWKVINIKLPEKNIDINLKERIFQFDTNHIAYVCYLHNTKTTDIYSASENTKNRPLERIKKVVDFLKTDNSFKDYQILTLVTVDQMGRTYSIPIVPSHELTLTFSAFPFIQLASTEKWKYLSLWKFAKSCEKLLQTTHTFSDILDLYSVYKAKDESFYLSDDFKHDFLQIVPNIGYDLINESKIEQNLHGAIAKIENSLVYIPVVKSVDYAPLYMPQQIIGYFALCLETFNYPIWITNKQKGEQIFHYVYNYADAIGFWLYKLYDVIKDHINDHINFPLEIELIFDGDFCKDTITEERESIDTEEQPYTFYYENCKIRFHISTSSVQTLYGSNNDGERKMMFELLNSFNQIDGVEMSNENISYAIDKDIPIGNAKMILIFPPSASSQFDTRWLISTQPLLISESETNMLLDELPLWIEKEYALPENIETTDEKIRFFNLSVKILFEKLSEKIQLFDYEYLLDKLINIHEVLLWKREHNRVIIPAQELCFGNQKNQIDEIHKNEKKLSKTTLSIRCLIEYLASTPTNGNLKASDDDIDILLVLMAEIINFGFLSDSINLNMTNPEVGKLKSGRIGISKEFFDEKLKPFGEAYAKENIDKDIRSFNSHFEVSETPEIKKDNDIKLINGAFLKDWGIGYFNIINFCRFCVTICDENQSSLATMKEDDFINLLQTEEYNLSKQEIISGLKHFSLENRPNYLIAPNGYRNNEVYPWKYNREFSFLRRFIIKYKNSEGQIILKWGFRNIYVALNQLQSLLFNGRLNNGGSEIRKLLGVFREEKGKSYRDKVKNWLKTHEELIVIDFEVKIASNGHLKSDNNYGDIDILVYNKSTKTILSLECKNTVKAKNIHEMKKEMDNYLGRDGKQGMIHKHLARHNWLTLHKQDVCTFLNITDSEEVEIRSYMITSEVIPTIYIKSQPIPLPIIAFPDLRREGLKIFDDSIC